MKQFSCQGKLYSNSMQTSNILSSVEKHNDDAKRNYFSSNRWDAPADIIMTEYRLEELCEYARERRCYTKHNSAYWHEGGIEAHQSETREAHLHQMNMPRHP